MPEVPKQPSEADIQAGIEFLQASLGIEEDAARRIGMVEMRGPDPRCGAMAVAEFFASQHGQERGAENLALMKEDIDSGATAEQALVVTFGRAAFTRDEEGELKRRPDIREDNVPPQQEGSEKK